MEPLFDRGRSEMHRTPGMSVAVSLTALLVLAAVALLCGCGGGKASSAASSSPFHPAGISITPTTPKPTHDVSQVTWDEPYGEPPSLDPLKSYALPANTILSNVCDALLR